MELIEIINNPIIESIIKENDVEIDCTDKSMQFQLWEGSRKYIAEIIDKDGAILDFGCANGFFLKCLQYWSSYKLDPWGIDINETKISKSKIFFPNKANQFFNIITLNKEEREILNNKKFEYIHWNIWDNYIEKYLKNDKNIALEIENTISYLKNKLTNNGKLALSLYSNNRRSNLNFISKIKKNYPGMVIKNKASVECSVIILK